MGIILCKVITGCSNSCLAAFDPFPAKKPAPKKKAAPEAKKGKQTDTRYWILSNAAP